MVEATGVRDIPSGPLLRIGHDRFLTGLARARRRGAARERWPRLFIQLIDFLAIRRRPEKEKFFRRFLEITDRHRDALRAVASTEEEIRERLLALPDEALDAILSEREL